MLVSIIVYFVGLHMQRLILLRIVGAFAGGEICKRVLSQLETNS